MIRKLFRWSYLFLCSATLQATAQESAPVDRLADVGETVDGSCLAKACSLKIHRAWEAYQKVLNADYEAKRRATFARYQEFMKNNEAYFDNRNTLWQVYEKLQDKTYEDSRSQARQEYLTELLKDEPSDSLLAQLYTKLQATENQVYEKAKHQAIEAWQASTGETIEKERQELFAAWQDSRDSNYENTVREAYNRYLEELLEDPS